MELDELRTKAAELFPLAAKAAVEAPGTANTSLESLNQLCADNYAALGFRCHADCFGAITPKLEGKLSLDAWCNADLEICGWNLNVRLRPFFLGGSFAHFEIRHNGPLPGVTQTGYRSVFTQLANFADRTPLEFLQASIPQAPREQQMTLF
jgi:hypothetical protein